MSISTIMFKTKVWGLAFLLLSQHVHARRTDIDQVSDELNMASTKSSDDAQSTSLSLASLSAEMNWWGEKGFVDTNKWPFTDSNSVTMQQLEGAVGTNANGISGNAAGIESLGNAVGANANSAATNAANIAQNTHAVNGLGGQVASNAGNIASNTAAINNAAANTAANTRTLNAVADLSMANNGAISAVGNHAAANTDAIGAAANLATQNAAGVGQNAASLNLLGAQATANANAIASNAGNIAGNTATLNSLGGQVASNAGSVAANTNAIGNVAANTAANSQTLNAVADLSMANTDAIAAVGNHAAANTDAIGALGNLATQNAAGVSQNAANINLLNSAVGANSNAIATNAGNIAGNTAAIGQLSGDVAANTANIASNAEGIGIVANHAAANTQAIGAVANHAAANTDAILAVGSHAAANTQAINAVGQVAAQNAAGVAANSQAIGVLGTAVSSNTAQIAGLTTSVGMLQGSVATNTAAIASLTAEVAVLSEAAAPTVALAGALGVSVETVATLALAGSFAGPLIGCILLVYVCWPQDEADPWLKVEARVARMINDRFNEERRNRLGARLKRYIMEFSRCSHAWVARVMSRPANPQPVQSLLQQVAHQVSGGEIAVYTDTLANATSDTINAGQSVPACMAQLEGHMSIERDEWLSAEGDSLSSLFMPFANMHTQILALLADYSPDSADMTWPSHQKMAAGEYASFMLEQMLKAWKSQVCRTMRVRHSMKTKVHKLQFFKWRYQFVVLKPIWQPNAGQYCKEECGSTGWCNYCGGEDVGACCILGGTQGDSPQDPSECSQFLAPPRKAVYPNSPYHTCMHTDCIQSNMYFYSSKSLEGPHKTDMYSDPGQCQEFCRLIPGAVVFNFVPDGDGFKCKCLGGKDAKIDRYYWKGARSGPTVCPKKNQVRTEEEKQETPNVPMEQVYPCEKSPLVENIEELEEKHPEWIQQCYKNATKVVAEDFNPFYRRFATFVDKLAWTSGCGTAGKGKKGTMADWDDEKWSQMTDKFDFGTFSQCDWKREAKRDDGAWQLDAEFEQGWTGTSRINIESQSKLQMAYNAPHWLDRLRGVQTCLAQKAAGLLDKDGAGAAAYTILKDAPTEQQALPAKPPAKPRV